MRAKDIKVGGEYLTYVSGNRVRVRVVTARKGGAGVGRLTKYQVERVDNDQLLPKWRSAQALHPLESYREAWPGMTEKQETVLEAGVAVEDLKPGDVFTVRIGPAAGKSFEVKEVIPFGDDYFRVMIKVGEKTGHITRPRGWTVEKVG